MSGTPNQRVIIDTDPGIDDAAALLFAFGSGMIAVDAVTTVFGNTDLEHCTRNALTILEAAGHPEVPVYAGAATPLLRDCDFRGKLVHGENGMGGVEFPPARRSVSPGRAAEQIVERVLAAPGEIDVIALGPLTNVAVALALEPRVAGAVRRLVVMGGAVHTWGNVTPAATANLFYDPEAASIVYRSGAPIVQVGMDVCRRIFISHERLARVRAADTPGTRLLMAITPFIESAYRRMRIPTVLEGRGVHYNDVPAVAYAMRPDLFETDHLHVQIETQGTHSLGQTVADIGEVHNQPPNAQVCVDADVEGVAELFTRSLTDEATR